MTFSRYSQLQTQAMRLGLLEILAVAIVELAMVVVAAFSQYLEVQ